MVRDFVITQEEKEKKKKEAKKPEEVLQEETFTANPARLTLELVKENNALVSSEPMTLPLKMDFQDKNQFKSSEYFVKKEETLFGISIETGVR